MRDEWVLPFVISGTMSECRDLLESLTDQHGLDEFLLPIFEMPEPVAYLRRIAQALALTPRDQGATGPDG